MMRRQLSKERWYMAHGEKMNCLRGWTVFHAPAESSHTETRADNQVCMSTSVERARLITAAPAMRDALLLIRPQIFALWNASIGGDDEASYADSLRIIDESISMAEGRHEQQALRT